MAKYRDFDKFFREQRKEPVVLRYQGEEHFLGASLPVATVLRLKQMEATGGQLGDDDLIKLFQSIFGGARYGKWVQGGMTLDEMVELMGWAMEAYGLAQAAPSETSDPNPQPTPETR